MARPAKSISATTGARTKEDIAIRTQTEELLKGDGAPACPDWLTEEQKELFWVIAGHYAGDASILGALDGTALAEFCIAVDRLAYIERQINRDPDLLLQTKLMAARKHYEATMWRGCNEFCLSPQARAKIGGLASAAAKEAADPLAEALA